MNSLVRKYLTDGALARCKMPGPSRSNRDTKQSPQGRMWTDIGRHTLQTSLTSWLLLAREAQAMQEKSRTCQANPHQAEVSLSWTMILTGGLNMSSFCVTTPSQMAKRKAKNCKNTPKGSNEKEYASKGAIATRLKRKVLNEVKNWILESNLIII